MDMRQIELEASDRRCRKSADLGLNVGGDGKERKRDQKLGNQRGNIISQKI